MELKYPNDHPDFKHYYQKTRGFIKTKTHRMNSVF